MEEEAVSVITSLDHVVVLVSDIDAAQMAYQFLFTLAPGAISIDPHLDRIKQLLLVYGLRQKIDRPSFYGLHRHRDIAMAEADAAADRSGARAVGFHIWSLRHLNG